jgi:AcrR family transcriptional regulator
MAEIKSRNSDWQTLAKNDWGDIVALSAKKSFQRKFQIIEAFTKLVSENGFHTVTHGDIARECRITRQLVDHHFPTDLSLLLLTYQYIYARFQKVGTDSLVTQEGTLNQFRAYLSSVANWVVDYRSDACFLTQHFALASVYPELLAFHERNMHMGQERIRALLSVFKTEGFLKKIPEDVLSAYAMAIQTQIAGYIVLTSALPKSKIKLRDSVNDLLNSCFAIIGLSVSTSKK